MQANLYVRALATYAELPIAKTVEYHGDQIVHAFVYGKYQRHSIGAWGVRYPLCRWMDVEGVRRLYFWDNKEGCTYAIDLGAIRMLGTPGQLDMFGGTLNVPCGEWQRIGGKLNLPWVPDEHRLVLPPCQQPWPMPHRVTAAEHPTTQRSKARELRAKREATARMQPRLFE